MANLSIKDVPDALAEALRQRAARNHRSLQGELMAIVEQAIQQNAPAAAPGVSVDRHGWPMVRQGWKSVDQVMAELKAKYPQGISSGPSSIAIIREDRDAR